ncbi:EAL domain-containing protein [Pelomonas sp. CA6]|uniref:putative bifunctional diguanylate cyclase/phosphodiesterase n=1 Tax=Pelomonas sp. CA6 TaxID=2907999 RepID=UPI001F4C3DAB|nr:EAL domain-containing protein [Pelomonas sp. CA6]MCH7345438.1 EAL domain-containing protein [Pelomonas sp. CA6]
MTELLLISSALQTLLGGALYALWRLQGQPHVRLWAWSNALLGLGLALGVALVDPAVGKLRLELQGLAAATAMSASLYCQLAGAALYSGRPWRARHGIAPLAVATLAMVLSANASLEAAIWVGALLMWAGNWLCAYWLWPARHLSERVVVVCYGAAGLVHLSGPMLHPLSRSAITHASGLMVQTTLALALILVSVVRAQREARLQARRFQRLADDSLQALTVLRHERVLYANPAAIALFGYRDLAQMMQADLFTEQVPSDAQAAARERHARVLADASARFEWEATRLARDGRQVHVRCLSGQIEWDGEPAELLLMLDDTAHQQALEQLRRQAHQDELTGLPNRNFVVQALQQITTRTTPCALISADVDRFQLINESLGHERGDLLLRALGERLLHRLPAESLLARLGEDQFLVLLERADPDSAAALVERIQQMLDQPFSVGGHELFVHLSIGVALYPRDARDAAGLLRASDSALHRAKAQPGQACVFFDPAMQQHSQARLQTEQALGRAIRQHEFLLQYQPKFSAGTRRLAGFEALVRWQPPEGPRISPADFIPAAERTGQIRALGRLILAIALEQIARWRRDGLPEVSVAVNASPLQFEDPGFASEVLAMLQQHGVAAEALEIEITETAAVNRMTLVLPQLAQLRQAGVRIALDDFGTGQSSLTMLRRLPIHSMKLDRSMLAPLPDPDALAILRASCVLGQSLRLDVVAEGVETEAQARAAEAQGCTHLQGYHLGRPLDAQAAGALLAASAD